MTTKTAPSASYHTVGHVNEGTSNPIYIDYVNNGVTTHNRLPGPDPSTFHAWGQEYECQYLNAHDNGTSTVASPSGFPTAGSDASDADYGTPYYLAGYDDQNGGLTPRSEWLQLQQDPNNHVFYSATWALPASPSDFYVDVVVNDDPGGAHAFTTTRGAFPPCPFNPSPTTANDILVGQ